MNSLLGAERLPETGPVSAEQATLYRQVLSLLSAQRRPAWYLGEGYAALQTLTNSYLRLLAAQGVIPDVLRDAALDAQIALRSSGPPAETSPFASHKTTSTEARLTRPRWRPDRGGRPAGTRREARALTPETSGITLRNHARRKASPQRVRCRPNSSVHGGGRRPRRGRRSRLPSGAQRLAKPPCGGEGARGIYGTGRAQRRRCLPS